MYKVLAMEPRLRANPEQFWTIIDFMERHGDLSKSQPGPQGRIKSDQLWLELTTKLNSLGGGVKKSSEKWKKVWADWKTKTKKKYLTLRQRENGIGETSRKMYLTALEKRVVDVIGVTTVRSLANIVEQSPASEPEATDFIEFPSEHEIEIELEDHTQIIETPTSGTVQCITPSQQQFHTPYIIVTEPKIQALSPSPPPAPSPTPPSPTPASPTPPSPAPPTPSRRNSSASRSTVTNPRRGYSRGRRRGLTPFERAADRFATVEQNRLEHEEERDKRLHEREMERLKLEAERIAVTRQQNLLLHQLSLLGQHLVNVISQQRPFND